MRNATSNNPPVWQPECGGFCKNFHQNRPVPGGRRGFLGCRAIFALPLWPERRILRAPRLNSLPTMSKHNSLKSSATVGGKRSVLKRFERVKLLKERGEWKDGRSPVGLPKTKHLS